MIGSATAFAVVATAERRLYGNVILKKGVLQSGRELDFCESPCGLAGVAKFMPPQAFAAVQHGQGA